MTALVFSKAGIFQTPGHCDRYLELNSLRQAALRDECCELADEFTQRVKAHLMFCEQCQVCERYEDDPGIQFQLTKEQVTKVWEVLG